MKVVETMKVKLHTDKAMDIAFSGFVTLYTEMCDYISNEVFNTNPLVSLRVLNKALYYQLRAEFASKAQMTQSAMKTVLAAYKTVNTQLMQNPYRIVCDKKAYTFPRDVRWLKKPIQFKNLQADFVYNRDWSFTKDGKLSINTLDKRVKVDFEKAYTNKFLDGTWKAGTAKLFKKGKFWYFAIPMSKEFPDVDKDDIKNVVGIDRGLRFLVTAYDGKNTKFLHGTTIASKRKSFQEVRSQCQSKGTKSAKRVLKRISGRENRYMQDVNHQIAKALVEMYGSGTLFVLEDLTGVSFNTGSSNDWNRELRSWAFYDLEMKLNYKANESGSIVQKVDAHYTSQRCPKCGKILKSQRNHELHEYKCSCGYRTNDDRCGSMNIYELGMQWLSGIENPTFN